jgi:large subunit ribosomal protein L25
MSEISILAAESRERAGKGTARAARRAGRIPAVIYGDKKEPLMFTVEERLIKRELKRAGFFTRLYDVELAGKKHRVLARDVHFDPVTDAPLHIDFLRVSKTTSVTVEVPVSFVNEESCPGIEVGGVLNVVRHTVELDCRADDIPASIEVDLSGFEVGASIHISHVKLPDGVTPAIQDRDFTIATISAPSALRSEASDAAEAEGEEEAGEAEE